MVFWEGYMSDEMMGTVAPIVVYWLYGGFLQLLLLLPPMQRYRLHSQQEQEEKNTVALPDVVKAVLLQQCLQAAVAQLLFLATGPASPAPAVRQPPIAVQLLQIAAAMLVMDTWQYFIHRWLHRNPVLYRHIHSRHHRLVVPYAVGALYNHLAEGLLVDTLGGAVAFLISGMTARTAVYFFCLAVAKTVDDHSGLMLPGTGLFRRVFENNGAYHEVHHSAVGVKYNYSQPFFPLWDKIMGTYMPFEVVDRHGGGYEVKPLKKTE